MVELNPCCGSFPVHVANCPGRRPVDDFTGCSLAELEAMPREWRYDEASVLRDPTGRSPNMLGWMRAVANARNREGVPSLAPGPVGVERARSLQLATLAEELLGKLTSALENYWATTGDVTPDDELDMLDDYREAIAEACCAGEHDEDAPHTDFRETP